MAATVVSRCALAGALAATLGGCVRAGFDRSPDGSRQDGISVTEGPEAPLYDLLADVLAPDAEPDGWLLVPEHPPITRGVALLPGCETCPGWLPWPFFRC